MKKHSYHGSLLLIAFWLAALSSTASFAGNSKGGSGGTQCAQPLYQYGGRAYALDIDLNLLVGGNIHVGPISDTGSLSSTGGMLDATFLSLTNPAPIAINADILDASVVGSSNMTVAYAGVVALDLNVADILQVSAGVLQSTASESGSGSCPNIGVGSGGSGANIADLAITVAGVSVPVNASAPPNTTITVPGVATIVVNEQYVANGTQSVNALHITLLALATKAEVIIAHAEANLTFEGCSCTTPSCQVKDFVTGGGWITLPSGAKGTFGFVGGQKANGLQGHLNYIDHGTSQHIQGAVLSSYVIPSSTSTERVLTYGCFVNNTYQSCTLDVADNGEPGAGVDRFGLSSPSYSASGPTITKGNIQLHKPQGCGTTTKGK
jgi:hypothetical protein